MKEKRPNTLSARFTDAEYAKLRLMAERKNMSLSRMISELVNKAEFQEQPSITSVANIKSMKIRS